MNTHSKAIGYVLWIFGFMGAHRFYYGRPVTGSRCFRRDSSIIAMNESATTMSISRLR